MISRLLMHIPLLRRPFHQRDVARRERDEAVRQLEHLRRSAEPAPAPRTPPRDVAPWFGFETFYWHPDQDAEQDRQVGDFRALIRARVAKERPAVEVGPGLSPIIAKRLGYATTVVDHADAQGVAAKYHGLGLDLSQIEDVDVVWTGQRLAPAMPRADYAAIVASHMIEHAPDFVGFLADCTDMLAEDGRILLIVPDRRYCFDLAHPSSDVAKVLDDHRQQRRLHSFPSLFRPTTNIDAVVGGTVRADWGQYEIGDIRLPYGDPFLAISHLTPANEYEDLHENYFTPSSFVLLIEELRYLGQLKLMPRLITRARGCEFLVVLGKAPDQPRPALADYLERKKFLALNMLREEREALGYLGRLLGP